MWSWRAGEGVEGQQVTTPGALSLLVLPAAPTDLEPC